MHQRPRRRPTAGTLTLLTALLIGVMAAVALAAVRPSQAGAATSFTFAAFGDANSSGSKLPPAPFTKVMDGIKASGVTLAVSTGDFINDLPDSTGSSFSAYLGQESAHIGVPVLRASGDNDHLNDSGRLSAWDSAFSGLPTGADSQRRWFGATRGGVHFIFLGTDVAGRLGSIGYSSRTASSNSAQAKWLVKRLKGEPQPSTIVVVMHEPLVYGKSTGAYTTSHAAEAKALKALFKRYGVDMVIAGHTHVFRRTMVDGVPYLQVPACASQSHTSFGASTDGGIIPKLGSREAGWQTSSSYKGFLKVRFNASKRTLTLVVKKVSASSGTVSSAQDQSKNGNKLGGTFHDAKARR
jgi:Calcineurin-like phosphoesterase